VIVRVRCRLIPWLAGLALVAAGCDPDLPGKPNPKNRPVSPENVLSFSALFARNCAGCHGADGKLGPAPPLNDPLFRSIVSESDLAKVLNHGRTGTPMPAFLRANGGSLTSVQVQMLIDGIKGIRRERLGELPAGSEPSATADGPVPTPPWGDVSPAPTGTPLYAAPQGAVGNVARGVVLFAKACASCHGENGLGVTKDERVRNRMNDRAFLSLISDQALRRIIITGRPDLKMPDHSQKAGRLDDFRPLTSDEIADLVALLASWRKTP
jgi:cytochrome c oxidase cbb3-type subunit III